MRPRRWGRLRRCAMQLLRRCLSRSLSAAARCSAPGFSAAPKPNVAARRRPLNSKLGGGVAAPEWHSLLAAPLRRIAGGQCGVLVSRAARWALGAWGPLPDPAACRRWLRGGARRFSASRRGTEWGQWCYRVRHAQRCNQCTCAVPGRGSTASHQTRQCSVMYRTVSQRPRHLINLI